MLYLLFQLVALFGELRHQHHQPVDYQLRGVALAGGEGASSFGGLRASRTCLAASRSSEKKIAETGDKSLIWEGHKAGRDIGYCHLEKLHNLEALPADGFFISCFPHKIRGASAGWTRAVAIFEE